MDVTDLKNKLQEDFDLETWKKLLEKAFPNRTYFSSPRTGTLRTEAQKKLIQSLRYFGKVDLEGELGDTTLAFIEVQLSPDAVQLSRNRVGLRNLVSEKVVAGVRDAAIIAYHQPGDKEWRISFYSEQYAWDEDKGIVKKETHPKRYTFVVGGNESCKTPAQRLHKLVGASKELKLDNVMEAFSVEKVSNWFFEEYKDQYDKFVGTITGKVWTEDGVREYRDGSPISGFHTFFKVRPGSYPEKEARNFVKKLLGRIVFLYFVQKKGWLGAEENDPSSGSKNFIRELFNQAKNHDNSDSADQFYRQWLRKLFFDGLNNKDKPEFTMPDGSTTHMPYLNGGLFDEDAIDEKTEDFSLPDFLFHNPEDSETPEDGFDKFNKRGFLDFLDAFNFTIHEDSPGDHTVGVDPEMLGHIFENLLEDNKEKGAFYTPKPVVHYMCQESIIEYLNTELQADGDIREKIEKFIKKQETEGIVGAYNDILKALKKVKVCDPAIGSGAFPMGVLQEISQAVQNIWFASPDYVEEIWGVKPDDWQPAKIKKEIIQNSIYGVDIEKGAVDIAQLRFWLSLIVDEEEPTPLPNLDYKIVTGNSLISKLILDGKEEIVEINWDTDKKVKSTKEIVENLECTLNQIVEKQQKHFNSSQEQGEGLEQEIRNLKIDALIYQLQFDRIKYEQDNPQQNDAFSSSKGMERSLKRKIRIKEYSDLIKDLGKLKSDDSKPFTHFDWKLDFPEVLNPVMATGDELGFDIIIGNPPYIQLQKDGGSLGDLYENQWFETFERMGDIYSLFYEKGFELLKQDGVHTFITSNQWMKAGYGESLREYLSNQNPQQIIDLGPNVFDNATVNTNILIARKGENGDQLLGIAVDSQTEIKTLSKSKLIPVPNVSEDTWKILSEIDLKVSKRIKENGKPLKEWDLKINFGIKTGYNKAFIMDQDKRDELVDKHSTSDELIKPLIRGRNTERYKVKWNGKYIIKTFPSLEIDINSYPAVKEYLEDFLPRLKQEGETYLDSNGDEKKTRKRTSNKWFETQDQIGYHEDFKKPKVVWKRIGSVMRFSYLKKEIYCLDSTCIATGEKIKYLTALLNSKLCLYQLFKTSPKTGTGDQIISVQALDPLEVYYPNEKEEQVFEKMVDYMLFLKEVEADLPVFAGWPKEEAIKVFEDVIDGMVYELYFQEECEEQGIEILSHIDNEFDSIENADDDESREILSQSLKIALNENGDIHKNMTKIYKLEEVQAIEAEVN